MQKTNSAAEVQVEIEKQEALKKRAARQANKRELAPEIIPTVQCVVLPKGDGQISMGEHVAGLGTVHYEEGETFDCQLPAAVIHYERGYVNFEGAREAVADAKRLRDRFNAADMAHQAQYEKLVGQAVG